MAGQFSGGSWMEGRSTTGDGHWPVLRTEACRAVRTHEVLRDEVTSGAGVDRSRLLFKVVQAWFNVQTGRVQSRFKPVRTSGARGLEIRYKTSFPAGRSEEDHGTCRLQPNEASARVKAWQAQTLRFFRLLWLLGPPQSSKPQRLLAASESEPTLATDSVLGARHQLPSRADTTKRVDRNSPDTPNAKFCRARQQLHLPALPPPESISTTHRP